VLRVLLVGAELELVPASIAGHPAVRNAAKALGRRPGETLLDQNAHGPALRPLEDGARRGRPDIVHYSLLTLLESPLNQGGGLEVAVHTRNHDLLHIRSDTRLPRGEARFQGLMSKVLREGMSQDKDPLLRLEPDCEPADVLASFARGPIIRLDEHGTLASPADIAARAQAGKGDMTAIIGAFPSGDFEPAWLAAAPDAVSLWPKPLTAWAVAAELASAFRARWLQDPTPATQAGSSTPP
jgi:rRNA small subunit pseudouridine methyltransferase Nep1